MSREHHATYAVIGRNIRRLREEQGMSRPQLAAACGRKSDGRRENFFAKVEDGYGISVPLLLAVEKALGCNLYDLVPVEVE